MSTTPSNELDSLFQSELASVNEDVRNKAALAAFRKLHPGNRTTVEEFLSSLQRHKEMWAAVSGLGIVDFAESVLGRKKGTAAAAPETARRRTRINDEQKQSLRGAILRVLDGQGGGMSRVEISAAIIDGGLTTTGIDHNDLAEKLRQPLHELVSEGKVHTVGERRAMKYLTGKKGR